LSFTLGALRSLKIFQNPIAIFSDQYITRSVVKSHPQRIAKASPRRGANGA
jgi:hypothetical protein